MRRFALAAILGLVASLLLVGAARAGYAFSFYGGGYYNPQIVEQQSKQYGWPTTGQEFWVHNPLECAWDVDDYYRSFGDGDLAAGRMVSTTACIVADGYDGTPGSNHSVLVDVYAKTADLTVTVGNDVWLEAFDVAPVFLASQHRWNWHYCVTDWYGYVFPLDPDSYPVIADSNGGTGIPITYSLTIIGGSRVIRDVSASIQSWGYDPVLHC